MESHSPCRNRFVAWELSWIYCCSWIAGWRQQPWEHLPSFCQVCTWVIQASPTVIHAWWHQALIPAVGLCCCSRAPLPTKRDCWDNIGCVCCLWPIIQPYWSCTTTNTIVTAAGFPILSSQEIDGWYQLLLGGGGDSHKAEVKSSIAHISDHQWPKYLEQRECSNTLVNPSVYNPFLFPSLPTVYRSSCIFSIQAICIFWLFKMWIMWTWAQGPL